MLYLQMGGMVAKVIDKGEKQKSSTAVIVRFSSLISLEKNPPSCP